MDDKPIPTVTTWKGVQLSKIPRKDLEAEFAALASADAERQKNLKPASDPAPAVPIDPETARCLKEMRGLILGVEAGALALRRYCDDLVDQNGLHREVIIRVTLIQKVKP